MGSYKEVNCKGEGRHDLYTRDQEGDDRQNNMPSIVGRSNGVVGDAASKQFGGGNPMHVVSRKFQDRKQNQWKQVHKDDRAVD